MNSQHDDDNKNSDHTVPPEGDWTPEEDLGRNPFQEEPSEDLGPETGPGGTDQESNVPGNSKPASDPVDDAASDDSGKR